MSLPAPPLPSPHPSLVYVSEDWDLAAAAIWDLSRFCGGEKRNRLYWKLSTSRAARVGQEVEGVGGRTDAGSVDSGQDVSAVSPPDNSSWTRRPRWAQIHQGVCFVDTELWTQHPPVGFQQGIPLHAPPISLMKTSPSESRMNHQKSV